MKHIGTISIETERVILRKFTIADAEQMFENYCSKDIVTKYLTWYPHKDLSETKKYLNDIVLPEYQYPYTYRWAIVLKSTNQVVGCIDVVNRNESKSRVELGYVLSDDYWGQGIMVECGMEVLRVLFRVGYQRVEATHLVENTKSGRVMQKLGMTHEGTLKKYNLDRDGILQDSEIYSITAPEWDKFCKSKLK